jgi:hypothetical protein
MTWADSVDVTHPEREAAESPGTMLSFQKLDVYQRALQCLVVALEVIARLPKGHAELAAQLRDAAQSTGRISRKELGDGLGPMRAITTSRR